MAAATVTAGYPLRAHIIGDLNLHIVKFTALADTNTYVVPGGSGMQVLGVVVLSSSTNVTPTFTWSAQTLTALLSSGTPDVVIGVLTSG